MRASRSILAMAFLSALLAAVSGCRRESGPSVEISPPLISVADEFYDVTAADGKNVWVVGYNGKILHSEDGGKTWGRQSAGTEHSILAVQALDRSVLVAVGEQGLILRSENGGQEWTKVDSGTKHDLLSFCFASPKIAWTVGGNGAILRSEDGGQSWKNQSLKDDTVLNAVRFVDGNTGWIVGEFGKALYTTDGGANWLSSQGTNEDMYLFDVRFEDREHGWVAGLGGLLLESRDGGKTWAAASSPTPKDLYHLAFNPESGVGLSVGDEGNLFVRLPGSSTWTKPNTPPEVLVFLRAVIFGDKTNGWAVGGRGTILHTDDGGSRWNPLARS